MPAHNHDYAGGDDDGGPSYNRKSGGATLNSDRFNSDYFCYLDGSPTNVTRSTNDPPKTGYDMASVGSSKTVSMATGLVAVTLSMIILYGGFQYASTGFDNGDGDCRWRFVFS